MHNEYDNNSLNNSKYRKYRITSQNSDQQHQASYKEGIYVWNWTRTPQYESTNFE